jgi:hypothetical protein
MGERRKIMSETIIGPGQPIYKCGCGRNLKLVRIGDMKSVISQYMEYEFRCNCGVKALAFLSDDMTRYPGVLEKENEI